MRVGAGLAAIGSAAAQVRFARRHQRPTGAWRDRPVEPRGATRLGVSFRPRQAEAFGLDPERTLQAILGYPFSIIRLAAYWDRIEQNGEFDYAELDRAIDAVCEAGRQIICCVGAIKAFGYPEFFVPDRYQREQFREGTLVTPDSHPRLTAAAAEFITRTVERYRAVDAIMAWQVEHDAVDPLGVEHSWRLSDSFVQHEMDAVRAADATRPILLNGFLPTSVPVAISQRWRTRGQGDSLDVAVRLADIVGIDYYPRHAVARGIYLDGRGTSRPGRRSALAMAAAARGCRVMVVEGQAEPWESVTVPPNRAGSVAFSCRPEDIIDIYNDCLRWSSAGEPTLDAYLFWGAEYWLARAEAGDTAYLDAVGRVLSGSTLR
ncbi:MAG TPA: hypothetical protein VGF84_19085 [Micromonosporaceae bacterium]